MTIDNIVLLLIGGTRLITEAVIRHDMKQGAGQVRAYSGDEEGLTALRDRLQVVNTEMAARVKSRLGQICYGV